MNIKYLLRSFAESTINLDSFYERICKNLESSPREIWIAKLSREEIFKYLDSLRGKSPSELPLYGIPFAIKDNIDLANIPTTAGCPKFAYTPKKNSFVVQKLIDAGGIPIGKTNMDQFATGLVGVRSPYGYVPNKYAKGYISGGSSSGSASSVAHDLCAFSLGTDTAGSGRVPACFNKLIGYKPSRGILSIEGVVPACKSLDCISVFANNSEDAKLVFNVVAKYNDRDPYSTEFSGIHSLLPRRFRFAVPEKKDLKFFGNTQYRDAFDKAVENLEKIGGVKSEIDFAPFIDCAKLLYEGSWVYERYEAVGKFIEDNPDDVENVTREIILPKTKKTAESVFRDIYRLREYKSYADKIFKNLDFIITPTAGTCYKVEDVLKDPIRLNSNLGYYTNYMNLLDFCAISIPSKCDNGFPFGFTAVGKKFCDESLFELAKRYEELTESVEICVCGAHLNGCSLHSELLKYGANFARDTKTANIYKMFAIENGNKPVLIRQTEGGESFYVEIYNMTKSAFADFVRDIPSPLCIGKIILANGESVSGFLGESASLSDSLDISNFKDWREFKKSIH